MEVLASQGKRRAQRERVDFVEELHTKFSSIGDDYHTNLHMHAHLYRKMV